MSQCIIGLTTQDPYIQKEHTELHNILKFRFNWANIKQDTAIQKLRNLVTNVHISLQIERMSTKTRFEKEAKGNSEMAYSVCNHTSDNKIFFITSMITDRIGRHKLLLPINHKNYNFREKKNSQVMKERKTVH